MKKKHINQIYPYQTDSTSKKYDSKSFVEIKIKILADTYAVYKIVNSKFTIKTN